MVVAAASTAAANNNNGVSASGCMGMGLHHSNGSLGLGSASTTGGPSSSVSLMGTNSGGGNAPPPAMVSALGLMSGAGRPLQNPPAAGLAYPTSFQVSCRCKEFSF